MSADRPERIGQYEILGLIGRGAMGVLYHARDARGREVALKVMAAHAMQDEEARQRFAHEARLALRVQHRNVVRVFESGHDDDVPFIAMEFLRGQTLADRIAGGGPMTLGGKLDVVIQACEGLQCLHEQGIVHRDVKPSNIWLLEDGGVKLLDLGVAKHASAGLTQHGAVVGSAAYMAPEQLSGHPLDGRADVFAAGVVLFELLTGHKPFQGDTITAVMLKVLHDPTPDIRHLVPGLAPELVDAVERALRKDPAERYFEAAEFASDLRLARDLGEMPLDATIRAPAGGLEESSIPEHTAISPGRTAVGQSGQRRAAPEEARPAARAPDEGFAIPIDATVAPGPRRTVVPVPLLDSEPPSSAAGPPARVVDTDPVLHRTESVPGAGNPVISGTRPRRGGPLLWTGVAAAVIAAAALAGLVLTQWRAAPTYVLSVQSMPSGAEISVDGTGTGQRTPAVLDLAVRPSRLGLTLTGYQPVDEPVSPVADGTTTLEYRLRRLLQVHSDPPGARIVLDGRDTGEVTPASLPLDEPYPAGLELRLEGHVSRRMAVTPGLVGTGTVALTLEPLPAAPETRAAAAAQVAVRLAGTYRFAVSGCGVNSPAAATHTVKVGTPCTLRLRAPDYFLDVARTVGAPRGGTVELAAPPLGKVDLRSRHQDCTLLVGGRAVGTPPVQLEIASGTYTAALQCPDGQTLQSRPFEIEAGTSVRRIDDYLR